MSPRSSLRAGRRRRVFADDSRHDGPLARPRIFRVDDGPQCRFNAAALRAVNAPLAAYFPTRPYALVVWFLAGLLPIGAVAVLAVHAHRVSWLAGEGATHSFSTALANWSASTTFLLAAFLSAGIYSVRRHRRDDYCGKYTVWRTAMVAALLASLDASVGLHTAWQTAWLHLTGVAPLGVPATWWLGAWTAVFGTLVLRLALEMRSSRAATLAVTGAVACYLLTMLATVAGFRLQSASIFVPTGLAPLVCGLFAHHLLIFAVVCYGREVVLEAIGQIESPVVRREKALAAKAQAAAARAAKKHTEAHASKQTPPSVSEPSTTGEPADVEPDQTTEDVAKPTADKTRRASKTKRSSKKAQSHDAQASVGQAADELLAGSETTSGPDSPGAGSDTSSPVDGVDTVPMQAADVDHTPDDSANTGADDADVASVDADGKPISKAERRRLRKQQKRQRRAA